MSETAVQSQAQGALMRRIDSLLQPLRSENSAAFALAVIAFAAFGAFVLYEVLPDTFSVPQPMPGVSVHEIRASLAAAAFIVALWILRPIPPAVTALLPIVLFPVLGIDSAEAVLSAYSSKYLITAGCCFVLGAAMHRTGLDLRAALNLTFVLGPVKSNVVRGVFVLSAFLSMWLPCAPLAILLCPVLLCMVRLARKFAYAAHHDDLMEMQFVLYCAAASGITIGALCMIVGSHINLAFAEYLHAVQGIRVSQVTWFFLGMPILLLSTVFASYVLTHVFARGILKHPLISDDVLEAEFRRLGPVTQDERTVGAILGGTVLLWILSTVVRASLADSLLLANFNVLTISVAAVGLIFTLSAGRERSRQLVRTAEIAACPWRVLFYIGGAVALGHAVLSSGAVVYLGSFLRPLLETESLWGLIAACLLIWLAANVFPNVAIHTMLPPLFATVFTSFTEYTEDAAIAMVLVGSATLVLPISSTSNVILFSAGFVPLGKFIRAGLTISAVVVPLLIGTPLLLGDFIKVYHPAEPHLHTLYGLPEQAGPEKHPEPEDTVIRDDTAATFPLPWHTKASETPAKPAAEEIPPVPETEE